MTAPMISAVDVFVRACRMLATLKLRESDAPGANDGPAVEAILASTGNKKGDPWCCAAMSFVGRSMLDVLWEAPNTAGCDVLLEWARRTGRLKEAPAYGAIGLRMKTPTDADHAFALDKVFDDRSFRTIEGNAADPLKPATREGDGMYAGRIRGTHADTAKYAFVYWWLPAVKP